MKSAVRMKSDNHEPSPKAQLEERLMRTFSVGGKEMKEEGG